jgi:hypothetical protein
MMRAEAERYRSLERSRRVDSHDTVGTEKAAEKVRFAYGTDLSAP